MCPDRFSAGHRHLKRGYIHSHFRVGSPHLTAEETDAIRGSYVEVNGEVFERSEMRTIVIAQIRKTNDVKPQREAVGQLEGAQTGLS